MDDVILNKTETIKRCLERIREEYIGSEESLGSDYTKQDSIILNLQRACEAALDLGMRIIRQRKLALPQTSGEVFAILHQAGILDEGLSIRLQKMVGFRNIAVHDYQKLELPILTSILQNHLSDFEDFATLALRQTH